MPNFCESPPSIPTVFSLMSELSVSWLISESSQIDIKHDIKATLKY